MYPHEPSTALAGVHNKLSQKILIEVSHRCPWNWHLIVVRSFVCSKLRHFKHAKITVIHHVVTVSLAKVRFPLVQCWLVHQRHIGHRAHHNAFIVNGHGLCVHPGSRMNKVSRLAHNPSFNICGIGHANQFKVRLLINT